MEIGERRFGYTLHEEASGGSREQALEEDYDAIRDVGLTLQKESPMFNEYVESMSENFRQATFAMVGGTDWSVRKGVSVECKTGSSL